MGKTTEIILGGARERIITMTNQKQSLRKGMYVGGV
jgi:hypothetical protein